MKKIYPTTKWAKLPPKYELVSIQIAKVREEFTEMWAATSIDGTIEELIDTEHAIQGALEMFDKLGYDVDEIRERVIKKNRERGYYEGV